MLSPKPRAAVKVRCCSPLSPERGGPGTVLAPVAEPAPTISSLQRTRMRARKFLISMYWEELHCNVKVKTAVRTVLLKQASRHHVHKSKFMAGGGHGCSQG